MGIIRKLKGWLEDIAKEVNAAGLMVVFGYINRDIEDLGRIYLAIIFLSRRLLDAG